MFGKPKQVKKLEVQLISTQTIFKMFGQLPADKQEHVMQSSPRRVAEAVEAAVAAGHGQAARQMVELAASSVPAGATAEQWSQVMDQALAALR